MYKRQGGAVACGGQRGEKLIQEQHGRRQEEIVRDLEHAGLLPGACELIRSLAEAGTPMGVASCSSHRWVDGWLNRLDIMPYFQTVICRDDGLPVKPDPALFLKAAENLGMQPAECLVLEDSQNGTRCV